MLGLFTIGIWQTITKRRNNKLFVMIENTAHAVSRGCLITFISLSFVGTTEAAALPCWKTLSEAVKFDDCWALRKWAWSFNLPEKPLPNWHSGPVELTTFISTDGKPIAEKQANKETKTSKKLSAFADEAVNILKDRDIQKIFLWFVFGVICGYGPFETWRREKPNV